MAALALFVGPDDSETCDGCEEAVNGNPYPVDEVPEPGEFECMSRCRHMIQLVGDDEEVDDGPTMKYTASIGFEPDPDAEIRTDENRFNFPPAVDDDLLTALQDGMTPTQGEEETPAPSTDAEKIAAFIGADVAIITPDNATEIAGIICDSGLDPEDVLASLNLSEEETALLTAACDAAQGKLVGDYSTWYVSELLDEDDADRLFDLAVGDYPQLKSMYATLAKQGFDDAYANQAITLAELISKWSSGAKAYIGEDGRWYVTVPSTFTEVRVIEKGTGSSGDRGHAGRPGQRGGSLPSHYNQSYLAKNIEKNLAEATKEERAFGKTWYPAAHDLAARYAKHYHVPLDKVIGVFAALSPQKAWEDEMRIVDEFFQHPNERHGQTDDNMEKARRIMAGEKPDVVLTGKKPQYQKTKNFYHNISDPTSTQWVTIDGHAAAMSVGHTADNIGQVMQNTHYETFAAAMKQVAEAHHMLPHEVQAITWLHWRNGAPAGRKPQKDSTPKWLKESEDDGIDFGDYSWGDGSSLPDWVDSNFKQQYPALFDTSMREGGAGSGDFGHAGRPGEVGGSGSNDLHLSKEDFDKKHGFQSDTALVDEEWFSRNRTTMTAWYTDKQIQLPTKYLATLDGVSHKSIGLDNPHVADYAQQMKAAGSYEAFRDAYTGINQDITLQVEHDGSQRIYEGNARALAAFKAGYKDVPVRIVFLGGGERRWRPTDIPNDLREGGAGLQEQTRASTGGSQVNLMHFCGYGAGDVDVEAKPRMVVVREGGAGSGDFGHAGRPGEVGGSTGTGHAQTAANEPGVVAGEKPPWEMNAPAPPRYPGDTSIYSPALPDSRTGEYVLGRRLQGTSLTNDPSNEVALYTFIPSSASNDELAQREKLIMALSDHTQLHPGELDKVDEHGRLERSAGNLYFIRGEYEDLAALSKQLPGWSQFMTDKTPGGKVINGTPLDHIRVVIPFSSDTPHNSVGPLSVSKETQDEMTKLLASTGQPEVWAHLDFNGMHLATTVAHGEGAAIEERLRSMGALADKEDHRPSGLHNTGATRFVPKDVNIERYGVTGRESWVRVVEGGAGSGDRGHAGRPGERGGSAAGDFHITVVPSEVHIDDGKGYTISVPGDHLTFFGVKDAKMGAVLLDEVQQVSKKFGVPVPDVFMTGYVESQQEGNNGMTAQNPITRQNVMVIDPRDFDQALLQSQGKLDSLHTAKAAWPPVMPAPTTTEEYGRMVVDHEMGHVLHNRFSNLETQQMQKVTLDVRDRWDTTRLRPYALYSPEEMFAEAFAMKVNGYEKYVPHELAKFIDSKVKKYGKDLREAWSSEMVRRPWFICDSRIGPPTYKLEKVRVVEGGAGSGDHGHAGRPGERGGSASTDALGIKFHTKAAEKFTIHGGDVSVKVIPTPSSSTDKIAAAVSQEIQHLKEAYDIPLPAHVFVGSAITSDGQNFDERAGADGVTMKSKEGLVLGIQPENAVRSSVPGGNDFWPQSLPYPDTVEEAVRFTTAHEMGHVLMYSMPNQWQHQMNQVTEDVHRRGEWDTDQLADYGNSDAAEMFAEAFANYSYGNEKYLPPRLRSFISETLAQKVWKHTVPGSMV